MKDSASQSLLAERWDLIAFDLDETLAPSKGALPDRMASALRQLLEIADVAVISGGAFSQFELQLLGNLNATEEQLARLHLMPTCGTRYCRFDGGELVDVYDHPLSTEQISLITSVLEREARRLGLWCDDPWGPIIENRHSQVTFSALGQQAPLEEKRTWDPTGAKKAALVAAVAPHLPDVDVHSGGSTSVDVTSRGVDKAYAMNALIDENGFAKESMLFFGDRLDVGGNDYPVRAAGWDTIHVDGWEDTAALVEALVDSMRGDALSQGKETEEN